MPEDPEIQVWSVPMRVRFRGLSVREGILLRTGPSTGGSPSEGSAWGEFSPFAEYDAAEAAAWLRCAREAAAGAWPAPVRDRVPVNTTVPAVGPERAHALVAASGCATAKVKVAEPGQGIDDDVSRVAAVRDALGPAGRVRVDANGAWSVEEALDALVRLDRAAGGLEYAEQPCAAVEDLARVRRRTSVPIAADESIRRAADPYRVRELEAADVAVLKVQPLGGVAACLRIAEEIGLPVVVSSAVESSVGLAAGVALAAALPELPHACGLGTATLLADDVLAAPLRPVDGALPVTGPVTAASGPSPDDLARCAADPQRDAWWRERYAAVAALLDAPDRWAPAGGAT